VLFIVVSSFVVVIPCGYWFLVVFARQLGVSWWLCDGDGSAELHCCHIFL